MKKKIYYGLAVYDKKEINAVNNVLKNIDKSASDLINTIKQKANATENKPPQLSGFIRRGP